MRVSCGLGFFRNRPSCFLGLFGAGRFVKARSSAVQLLLYCLSCFQTLRTAEKPHLWVKKTAPLGCKLLYFLLFIEVILLPRVGTARFYWWLKLCCVFAFRGVTEYFFLKKSRRVFDNRYFCSWDLLINVYVSRISDIQPASVHKLGKQSYLWSAFNFL